jgi:hypothetical protein
MRPAGVDDLLELDELFAAMRRGSEELAATARDKAVAAREAERRALTDELDEQIDELPFAEDEEG